jgi:hypothetical protein
MWRAGTFLLFAVCAGAQTTNPYDLARYLTSHKGTEWEAVWNAWGIPKGDTPFCDAEGACTVDLITITKPSQVILVIQSQPSDSYFRFRPTGPKWRYAGSTSGLDKNYGRRYEIARMGGKPFLKTSSQGANGSDWDSELESWFDLSLEKFEPVFWFTPRGSEFRTGFGVCRDVRAFASEGMEGTIELDIEIRFSLLGKIDLGFARYKARYARTAHDTRFTLREGVPLGGSARSLSNADFEKLVNIDVDDGPSDEQLVQFAMPRLKEIASGRDQASRKSLKEGIEHWEDSPAKRELLALIDRP